MDNKIGKVNISYYFKTNNSVGAIIYPPNSLTNCGKAVCRWNKLNGRSN